jgi:hypothetical protein
MVVQGNIPTADAVLPFLCRIGTELHEACVTIERDCTVTHCKQNGSGINYMRDKRPKDLVKTQGSAVKESWLRLKAKAQKTSEDFLKPLRQELSKAIKDAAAGTAEEQEAAAASNAEERAQNLVLYRQTEAILKEHPELKRATLDWLISKQGLLEQEGYSRFYSGKRTPKRGAEAEDDADEETFVRSNAEHTAERVHCYHGDGCLSAEQHEEDRGESTDSFRKEFPLVQGARRVVLRNNTNHHSNTPAQILAGCKGAAEFLEQPYALAALDNILNEYAAGNGPSSSAKAARKGGTFPNFRNIQPFSWDGECVLRKSSRLYIIGAK